MAEPRALTVRQLAIVKAFVEEGGTKHAAAQLGLQPSTVSTVLARARAVERVSTTPQLVAVLTRRGEL
jgi:hypothetical protein